MWDWLRNAVGAVGNAFNRGTSFVARNNPNQVAYNLAQKARDDARRRQLEQQRIAQQAQIQAQQRAQQQARVNAQQRAAIPKLNLNAALGALNKVAGAANPINQFKQQANQIAKLPIRKAFNQTAPVQAAAPALKLAKGAVNTFLPTTKQLGYTIADLGQRGAAVQAQLQAPLIKPLLNPNQRKQFNTNLNKMYTQADMYRRKGVDPQGKVAKGDINEFVRTVATKGTGAGLEIAPVVTGMSPSVKLSTKLIRGGTLGSAGNAVYSGLQGQYSPNKSAQEKALQAAIDLGGGYGGELLGHGVSKVIGKFGTINAGRGASKSAPQVAKNLSEVTDLYNQAKKYNLAGEQSQQLTPTTKVGNQKQQLAQANLPLSRNEPLNTSTKLPSSSRKSQKPKLKLSNQSSNENTLKGSGLSSSLESRGVNRQIYSDIPGYIPVKNKSMLNISENRVVNNEAQVVNSIINRKSNQPITAQMNADSVYLLNKYIKEGRDEEARAIAMATAKNATEAGRAVQILSRLQATTPDGALVRAQKIINEVNQKAKKQVVSLDSQKQADIVKLANEVQKYEQGTREWDVAAGKLGKYLENLAPVSTLKKISSIQTMMQLLNPKTAIRNVIGNVGMAVGEDVSSIPAAVLDNIVSKFTGIRTTAISNPVVGLKGAARGAKYGYEDALAGIKTSGLQGKFEIQPDVFKKGVMKKLQTALSVELGAADKAFYTAQFDKTLDSVMRANKVSKPTQDMLEIANGEALYATFQNNSLIAQGLQKAKGALNAGKDWGVGDVIIKYPKTPGNIVAVGLDYSPVGLVKGIYQLASSIGKMSPAVQREAVRNIGRSITGTGAIALGAMLASNGIITAKANADRDIAALDRENGMGPFSFNFTALQRMLRGEDTKPRAGDVVANYDWMQPAAISLSMGANMVLNAGKGIDNKLGDMAEAIGDSANTIIEQPVLQGLSRFVNNLNPDRGGGLGKAVTDVVSGVPASFVPSLVNQVGQLTDNVSRSTYDPNALIEAGNKVKARLPLIRSTLNPAITTLGKTREMYQDGTNNIFNVFFNPAFVKTIRDNEVVDLVKGIQERSGETQQAPRLADKKITINGQDKKLSAGEYTQYQKYIGEKTNEAFTQLTKDPKFMSLSDEDKAKKMSNILTDINNAAKIELFGNQPKTVTKDTKRILGGNTASYIDEPTNPRERYQEALNSYNENKDSLSDISKIKKQKEIRRLGAQANFSQDVVDLYSLSKREIFAYVKNSPNGKALMEQAIALDDELAKAGFSRKLRNKYGQVLEPGVRIGRGRGRGRRGRVAKYKLPKFKVAKISRGKAPKLSKAPRLKLRNYT